ncbi:MAG: hypothetical protein V3V10_11075 [Planctomycetota bacterium]
MTEIQLSTKNQKVWFVWDLDRALNFGEINEHVLDASLAILELHILGEATAKDGKVTIQGVGGFEFAYDGGDFKAERKNVEIYDFEGENKPEVFTVTDYFEPEIWQKYD